MSNIIKLLIIISCVLFSTFGYSQTADVTKGCAPLNVNFSTAEMNSYYWDFGDGTESTLRFPEHEFINPGTYTVILYTSLNGQEIGRLDIKVFDDPVINIESDIRGGCRPLTVSFKGTVDTDPDILVQSYLWTFGDGGSATSKDVIYTYGALGVYTVSLQITTNYAECQETYSIKDYITVDGPKPDFALPNRSICTTPATFNIDNLSEEEGSTFSWDFGNGTTSDEYEPGSVTYDEFGIYTITLTMTSSTGCAYSIDQNVNVGPPILDIEIPMLGCTAAPFIFNNKTLASSYSWDFGLGAIPSISNEASPVVSFPEAGNYEITLIASSLGCEADTTFNLSIEDNLNIDFTLDPTETCLENFQYDVEASNLNYDKYIWNDSIEGPAMTTLNSPFYERDSLYINAPYIHTVKLRAETDGGCIATTEKEIEIRKPEAYFIPSAVLGWKPFTVTFNNHSESVEPIIRHSWDLGDGITKPTYNDARSVSTTYEEKGYYYVNLEIENDAGCIDKSKSVQIEAACINDFIGGGGMCNGGGEPVGAIAFCAGTEIEFEIIGANEQLDIHINGDDGRMSHCWKDRKFSYVFETPGVFPIGYTSEYKGLLVEEVVWGEITVIGSKPVPKFKIDCDDPYTVNFSHESIRADHVEWYLDGEIISNQDKFSYTFDETGYYNVYLKSWNDTDDCPFDNLKRLDIFITDIKAGFKLEDRICAGTEILIDASTSVDVNGSCSKGYLWEFSKTRPREVDYADLEHQFVPGENQTVSLTVTDINGCTDKVTQTVSAYSLKADFDVPALVCLPHELDLIDNSTSDLEIEEWTWTAYSDTISNDQNHNLILNQDLLRDSSSFIFGLNIKDELGCESNKYHVIELHKPTFDVVYDRPLEMCVGDEINFSVINFMIDPFFQTGGLDLKYEWDFGIFGSSTDQNGKIVADQAGIHPITLTVTEASSGCSNVWEEEINVVNIPIADFSTSVDDLEHICINTSIRFTNQSIVGGQDFYIWDAGNGSSSIERDPAFHYDRGPYEITMIAISSHGCRDTITKAIELVGPEGNINADKSEVCLGELVTFSFQDTSDISEWTWDFGDGTTVSNQNPVSHEYGENIPSNMTEVSLILRSAKNDCELIQRIPIEVKESGYSRFDTISTLGYCSSTLNFINNSVGNSEYLWEFSDGTNTIEDEPTFTLMHDIDSVAVTLQVKNDATGCVHRSTQTYRIPGNVIGDYFKMPTVFSPNGDDRNDYFNYINNNTKVEGLINVKTFKIYNRWGNLVYDNQTPMVGWDGIYNNSPAPVEVYPYYIEFEVDNCETINKKGSVTIVR